MYHFGQRAGSVAQKSNSAVHQPPVIQVIDTVGQLLMISLILWIVLYTTKVRKITSQWILVLAKSSELYTGQ